MGSTAALDRGLTSLCCSCPSLRTSTLPATLRSRSNQVCQSPPPYGSTLTMRKSDLMLLETGFSLRQGLQGKQVLACSTHAHAVGSRPALKQALQQEWSTALCTSCITAGAGRHLSLMKGCRAEQRAGRHECLVVEWTTSMRGRGGQRTPWPCVTVGIATLDRWGWSVPAHAGLHQA